MNALRHHRKQPLVLGSQSDETWRRTDGTALTNLSGASLTQSLRLRAAAASAFEDISVTPSSGFDSHSKQEAESCVLKRLPWVNGCLWASSGSDAIEQAVWAIDSLALTEQGSGLRSLIVRRGGYHGSTLLGRALSSRVSADVAGRCVNTMSVHFVDELGDLQPEGFLAVLRQLWLAGSIATPALVLLEPYPTTGRRFVPEPRSLEQLLLWAAAHRIYVVFDEIACGAYRHGAFSICERLPGEARPTATVLSKGLTCGVYPLSVLACSHPLAAAIRNLSSKPPSFTYGLTEFAARVLVSTLGRYAELQRNGVLGRRKECTWSFAESLRGCEIEVEYSDTTVRLAAHRARVAAVMRALVDRGMWAYEGSAWLRNSPADAAVAEWGFIHICPPLDIPATELAAHYERAGQAVSAALVNAPS